ncbi:MAG: hypothetical protein IKV94_02630 [Clostridia bacterium]|nr:hypothetical protein [Clostridia bacterium]MBR6517088.1 hypothetical protein [Bacilli bacterium]
MIKKIQIEDTIYSANVDFRIVIECNKIAEDKEISDFERGLAIIYMVYGEKGLENSNHYELLLRWALNYFSCGKEVKETNKKPDMDFIQDMDYIEASFMSDYHIDLENVEMDWHKFNKLLNGLSNSETGNCCILNRVRNLRNIDLKDIKDKDERQRIKKAKQEVALKENNKPTATQIKRRDDLLRQLGLERSEHNDRWKINSRNRSKQ